MARPREFDVDEAVGKAMLVFWEKGYDGASLADLLAAMGIARGSLYKAFLDKRSLYLSALRHYDGTVVADAVCLLEDDAGGDGARRIAALLHTIGEAVARRRDRRGCFLCNAAVDRAPFDAEVESLVTTMMRRLDRAFRAALDGAAAAAAWDVNRRDRVAGGLTAAYMGLRVLAKAGRTPGQLEETAQAILAEAGLTAGT